MTCRLKRANLLQRVIALLFVFLFAFLAGIQPISAAYAVDAHTYYIQMSIDTSNWMFVGAVVNDKDGLFGNFTETERIGSDELKTMLANSSSKMFSEKLNSEPKKGSGGDKDYRVLSFPGFDPGIIKPQASSAQMDRALFIKDSLVYDLNTAIRIVYSNKNYSGLDDFRSDIKAILSAAQSAGTVNGWRFTRASDSKLNDTANEVSASDYVIISKGNDSYTLMTGVKKYPSSMADSDKPSGSGDDTQYVTWGMLAYEAFVNTTLEKDAVTAETVYNATSTNVLETAITGVMTSLVNGVRSLLGLWDIDSLIFNKGLRGSTGYVSGIFPVAWEPYIWAFFLISEILSVGVILFAIGKHIADRAAATVNPTVRANAMEQIKDMGLTVIILALLPVILVEAMKLSASLTRIFTAIVGEHTIAKEIGHFSGGNSLAAVILGILNLIINVYFNCFYALRALIVAVLIALSPLFVVTLCLGSSKRPMAVRGLSELVCNIFMQPIHAFMFSFILLVPKTGRPIESLVMLYAVIPLTAMLKGLVFPGSGEATHRIADQAGRASSMYAKKVGGLALGGAKGLVQGAMAANRAEKEAEEGAGRLTDNGKGDAQTKQKNVNTDTAPSTPADPKSKEMDRASDGAGEVAGGGASAAGAAGIGKSARNALSGAFPNSIREMGDNLMQAAMQARGEAALNEAAGASEAAQKANMRSALCGGTGGKLHSLAKKINQLGGKQSEGAGQNDIAMKADTDLGAAAPMGEPAAAGGEAGEVSGVAEGPDNVGLRYDADGSGAGAGDADSSDAASVDADNNSDGSAAQGTADGTGAGTGAGESNTTPTFGKNLAAAMNKAKSEMAADKAENQACKDAAMEKSKSPDARIRSAKRRMVAAAALTGAVRGWGGQIFCDPTRGGTMMNNARRDLQRAYEDKRKAEQSEMDDTQRQQTAAQMTKNYENYNPGVSLEKPLPPNDAAALGQGTSIGDDGSELTKQEAEMAGITNARRSGDGMAYNVDLNKLPEGARNNLLDAASPEGRALAEEQGYKVDLHHRKNPATGQEELTGRATVRVGKNGITGQNAPRIDKETGTITSENGAQPMIPNMAKLKSNAEDRKAYDEHFNASKEHEKAVKDQIAPVKAEYDQQSQALTSQTAQTFDMMQDKNGMNKEIRDAVGKNKARNDAVSASAAFGYEPEKIADPKATEHAYEATYDAPTLQSKGIKDFQMSDDGRTASYNINPNDKSITNPDMLEMIDSVQNPHSGYSQQAMLDKYAKQGTEITMNSDNSWSIKQHAKTSQGFAMTDGSQGDVLKTSGGTNFVATEKNESFVPAPIRQADVKQGSNINRIQSQKQIALKSNYDSQVETIRVQNPKPAMNESAARGAEYAERTHYQPQERASINSAGQPPVTPPSPPVQTDPPVRPPVAPPVQPLVRLPVTPPVQSPAQSPVAPPVQPPVQPPVTPPVQGTPEVPDIITGGAGADL